MTVEPAPEPEPAVSVSEQELGDDDTIVVDSVTTPAAHTLLVTYESDGESIVAANESVSELDEDALDVELGETDGVPGEHTVHLLPTDELSDAYESGDVLSEETATHVVAADSAQIDEADEPAPSPPPSPAPTPDPEPEFAVSITDSNTPIEAGETLEVTAAIDNTGDASGETTVTLSLDGQTLDEESVSVSADDSTSVTLVGTVDEAGEYTALVELEDDSATTEVLVEEIDDETDEETEEDETEEDDTDEETEEDETEEDETEDDETDEETEDETEDDETDEETEEDDTDDDDGQPGFGIVVGAVALVAGALAARRLSNADSEA